MNHLQLASERHTNPGEMLALETTVPGRTGWRGTAGDTTQRLGLVDQESSLREQRKPMRCTDESFWSQIHWWPTPRLSNRWSKLRSNHEGK
jgi:hypothetical protein